MAIGRSIVALKKTVKISGCEQVGKQARGLKEKTESAGSIKFAAVPTQKCLFTGVNALQCKHSVVLLQVKVHGGN